MNIFYSVFGSKSKWYHEKDVTICEKQRNYERKKSLTSGRK